MNEKLFSWYLFYVVSTEYNVDMGLLKNIDDRWMVNKKTDKTQLYKKHAQYTEIVMSNPSNNFFLLVSYTHTWWVLNPCTKREREREIKLRLFWLSTKINSKQTDVNWLDNKNTLIKLTARHTYYVPIEKLIVHKQVDAYDTTKTPSSKVEWHINWLSKFENIV